MSKYKLVPIKAREQLDHLATPNAAEQDRGTERLRERTSASSSSPAPAAPTHNDHPLWDYDRTCLACNAPGTLLSVEIVSNLPELKHCCKSDDCKWGGDACDIWKAELLKRESNPRPRGGKGENMSILNRIHNSKNPHQGKFPRVVCVCSAGLLRSPTLARVLSQDPYLCNTRAAGASNEFALIPLDDVLVSWADVLIFVSQDVFDTASAKNILTDKECLILNIPDKFAYMDQQLVTEIKNQLTEVDFLGIIRSYKDKIPEQRKHTRISSTTQK